MTIQGVSVGLPVRSFLTALICALVATPVARRYAAALGFIDMPNCRKRHTVPTALMGGVAVYAAVVIAVVSTAGPLMVELAPILLGATVVTVLGLLDDRFVLAAATKGACQTLVAIALAVVGVRFDLQWLPGWANICLTVVWLLGITNAFNLLDNTDGLSAGVAAIGAAVFVLMAVDSGQTTVAVLGAAVCGSCVGFLFFNKHPASIFMGDAGSLFLGLALAFMGAQIRFPGNTSVVAGMVPIMVLGVPILDTFLVIVSRMRRGINPMTHGATDHASHRMTGWGLSVRQACLIHYVAACAGGLVAFATVRSTATFGGLIGGVSLAVGALIVWVLERPYRKPPCLPDD